MANDFSNSLPYAPTRRGALRRYSGVSCTERRAPCPRRPQQRRHTTPCGRSPVRARRAHTAGAPQRRRYARESAMSAAQPGLTWRTTQCMRKAQPSTRLSPRVPGGRPLPEVGLLRIPGTLPVNAGGGGQTTLEARPTCHVAHATQAADAPWSDPRGEWPRRRPS